jgi:beta-glucosidase
VSDFNLDDLGNRFRFGVSAAAYQTEGGWNADGKGASVWDTFSSRRGKIYRNQNADVACDFYSRYADDLRLLSHLGIPDFRFSIAWSRILPLGRGKVNEAGIAFYNALIDECLQYGITPWVTLYHWDLPQSLEDRGGWINRDILGWFTDYVDLCIRRFGDRVKHWIILNEPMAFTGAGYFLGVHAPGRRGLSNFLAAVHHAALCQAEGARAARAARSDIRIGTTFSCSPVDPYREGKQYEAAALRVDALLNRLFVEPLAGKGYPVEELKFLRHLEPYIKDGDEARLAYPMDFIGIQCFFREVVSPAFYMPYIGARTVKAAKRRVPVTLMGWEIHPDSLYRMIKKFDSYGFNEIIVTENGAAFSDTPAGDAVHDDSRIQFLDMNLKGLLKARREGVNVNGYFVWSFTDNFEWAEGYRPRFGLVYVDFDTQQRIVKDSGYWYSSLVKAYQTRPRSSSDASSDAEGFRYLSKAMR